VKVVQSSPHEEEPMDQALTAFREAADRENLHRRVRRRYSSTLRQQAVEYWQRRRRQEGVRAIAAALGVSVTTLQRWTRRVGGRSRFRRVEVCQPVMAAVGPVPVAITMTADGPRVEGLTVETAARLLTLLR
jgi:transposase-like protein